MEPSKKKYYVVGVIGSGNTSKLFHAVDLDCKEYAIKMYAKRFDGNTYLKTEDSEEKGQLYKRNHQSQEFQVDLSHVECCL